MTPSPDASDAAVIKAFAGIPGLLEQAPALMARGRALDCECLLGPLDHPKPVVMGCPIGGRNLLNLAIDHPHEFRTRVTIMEQLGHFPMSENSGQFRRYIAPVLGEILEHSTITTKQGAHV